LIGFCLTVVLEFTLGVAVASATTLIMPNRDALKGTAMVVWGNTTQANGTADSIDCGDGTITPGPTVTDQSYISGTCTYANAGTFNAKLTVGAEVATAVITVRDPAALSAFDLRATKINMAIEDGLRSLYFNQFNRAVRFGTNIGSATPMTSWRSASADNETNSFSALAVLAIQNHGHAVNGPATDIFQPVVQNGLNWLFDHAIQKDLTPCSEGGAVPALNPCVGVPAPVNIGLAAPADGLDGYATPIFAAAIGAAAAAAPARTVAAGIGSANSNFVAGKTYAEVLQRVANAVSWGQSDGPTLFGWYYNLQAGNSSDGSTMGWALLGLENAAAAGATIPAEVKARLATTLTAQLNNNGSLDYQGDSSPTTTSSNTAKTGIGLQGLAVTGALVGDPRVALATGYLVRNWNAQVDPIDFNCAGGSPTTTNKGCGYSMFNVFKGLRLYGINTLPGIGRPAGPGPIPADDWYADYVDNLLANQHNPTSPTGGEWSTSPPSMGWSCCETDQTGITALAELILAPTAFVAPSAVSLAPAAAANPVGTNHTVTATATTAAGAPAPGATVTFTILSGPNAGPATCSETGGSTNTTDASGQAKCTYHDNGGAGTDQIQASIGAIVSNVVSKLWGGAVVATNIPTLSEWGLLIMAGLLGLASLWALRRRKDRTG
jgi:hypothetical protein